MDMETTFALPEGSSSLNMQTSNLAPVTVPYHPVISRLTTQPAGLSPRQVLVTDKDLKRKDKIAILEEGKVSGVFSGGGMRPLKLVLVDSRPHRHSPRLCRNRRVMRIEDDARACFDATELEEGRSGATQLPCRVEQVADDSDEDYNDTKFRKSKWKRTRKDRKTVSKLKKHPRLESADLELISSAQKAPPAIEPGKSRHKKNQLACKAKIRDLMVKVAERID